MNPSADRYVPLRASSVAIAADDPCFARVLGNYLLDHGVFARCDAYCRGRDLLAALERGAAYPVIVLDERLREQEADEFVRALAAMHLHKRPAVFVVTRYRYPELCESLSFYGPVRCLARMNNPKRLVEAIYGWYDSFAARLPSICDVYYREWDVQGRRRDCAYLTDAVLVVLDNRGSNLLRKQVLLEVAQRRGIRSPAVESGLQRMIRAMENCPTTQFLAFLQRHDLSLNRVTPIRLVNALAEEIACQHLVSER